MRGDTHAGALRPGRIPARERMAAWIDARVRKRRADRREEAIVIARIAAERSRARRAGAPQPSIPMVRRPY